MPDCERHDPDPDASPASFDVVAIGSALVDVLARRHHRGPGAVRHGQGVDDARRPGPGGHPLRGHGAGHRGLGRLGGEHGRGRRRAGGQRGIRGQGGRRRAGRGVPPRHHRGRGGAWAAPARVEPSARPGRRPGHGAMSGVRHRRRGADDGDPPGRGFDAWSRGISTRTSSPGPRSCTSRAICGTSGRPRRPCAGPCRWRTRRTRSWPSACPTRSACNGTRASSWSCCTATSMSCSPTRTRPRCCSARPPSTPPLAAAEETGHPGRAHPGRGGVGGRGRLGADPPSPPIRWHGWPTPPAPETSSRRASSTGSPTGKGPETLRPPRWPVRGRGHLPYRCPAPGRPAPAGRRGRAALRARGRTRPGDREGQWLSPSVSVSGGR